MGLATAGWLAFAPGPAQGQGPLRPLPPAQVPPAAQRPPVPDGFTPQPGRVSLPADWRTRFMLYGRVDREDAKQIRFQFISPEALRDARPGQPLPDGTVLVMEVHRARVGPDGALLRGQDNRLVAEEAVVGVEVMQKRQGWGAGYPNSIRNGDWEYARFAPDLTLRAGSTAACFQCHKPVEAHDYSFVAWPYVNLGWGVRGR